MPHDATLELYQVHAVTEGTDAQAEVSVRLSEDGRSVTGRGADPDTLVASARAYLAALNKLTAKSARDRKGCGRRADRASKQQKSRTPGRVRVLFTTARSGLRGRDHAA